MEKVDQQDTLQKLVNENLYFLRQGRSLIADLEPEQFSTLKDATGNGTVGAHFRHCIDMYNCFLNGLSCNLIDYINRERDKQVEQYCHVAERKIAEHIYQLLDLREHPPQNNYIDIILVTDSEDSGAVQQKIPSSIMRELFMLSSHTVHHYALIAQILSRHEIDYPEYFGVAPSTLAYWKKQ